MSSELPAVVRILSRLLPSSDREAIVGDLLEDAEYHNVTGARRGVWLAAECGVIAAGLSITRVRGWLVVPPARELAAGLALDGSRVFRGAHPGAAIVGALILCGSIATMAFGVELLVAALMSAAGI